MYRPALILENGKIVRQGDLLRIETSNRGAVVGKFVNATMDMFDREFFNIRVDNGVQMETVQHRYITRVMAY